MLTEDDVAPFLSEYLSRVLDRPQRFAGYSSHYQVQHFADARAQHFGDARSQHFGALGTGTVTDAARAGDAAVAALDGLDQTLGVLANDVSTAEPAVAGDASASGQITTIKRRLSDLRNASRSSRSKATAIVSYYGPARGGNFGAVPPTDLSVSAQAESDGIAITTAATNATNEAQTLDQKVQQIVEDAGRRASIASAQAAAAASTQREQEQIAAARQQAADLQRAQLQQEAELSRAKIAAEQERYQKAQDAAARTATEAEAARADASARAAQAASEGKRAEYDFQLQQAQLQAQLAQSAREQQAAIEQARLGLEEEKFQAGEARASRQEILQALPSLLPIVGGNPEVAAQIVARAFGLEYTPSASAGGAARGGAGPAIFGEEGMFGLGELEGLAAPSVFADALRDQARILRASGQPAAASELERQAAALEAPILPSLSPTDGAPVRGAPPARQESAPLSTGAKVAIGVGVAGAGLAIGAAIFGGRSRRRQNRGRRR